MNVFETADFYDHGQTEAPTTAGPIDENVADALGELDKLSMDHHTDATTAAPEAPTTAGELSEEDLDLMLELDNLDDLGF